MPQAMRLGSEALAAILGGPGIFYLWLSFSMPSLSLKAFLFLAAATTINLMLYPDAIEATRGFAGVQRLLGKMTQRTRRR
jgi:hypothetical protein